MKFKFRFESLKSISILIPFVYKLMIVSSKNNRENYPRKCFLHFTCLYHVSWWYYTLVIDLIGRLYWQTTPITSQRNWPVRSITRVKYHQLTCYNSFWLWRRLPHRLSKRQSLSTTTVWFRTTFPRTIKLNLLWLLKWLVDSNLSQK